MNNVYFIVSEFYNKLILRRKCFFNVDITVNIDNVDSADIFIEKCKQLAKEKNIDIVYDEIKIVSIQKY